MLKIKKLVELIDIANVELEHDIPDGTVFEYKNNCYIVKRVLKNFDESCREYCDIEKDFDNDIEKSDVSLHNCGDNCPFGWYSAAIKLSEIETLILKNKE